MHANTHVCQYHAPLSVQAAVRLLASEIHPSPYAGGTDWLPHGAVQPRDCSCIVDVKRIPELLAIDAQNDGSVRIGAAASFADIAADGGVRAAYPGLVDAANLVGSVQVRNRASIGGNLCNASPAADSIPALLVNAAECMLTGPGGTRQVAVEDFVVGPGRTCRRGDELLVAVTLPKPPRDSADAFVRITPRTEMDIAIASAAARVALDSSGRCTYARIAIGAVGPVPVRVHRAEASLVGRFIDAEVLGAVDDAACSAARPIADQRGSAEYRREVIGVLARRAVMAAIDRVHSTPPRMDA